MKIQFLSWFLNELCCSLTENEIAAMFSDNTTYIPPRPGEARITLADISRAAKFGYSPSHDIKDYIQNFKQRSSNV